MFDTLEMSVTVMELMGPIEAKVRMKRKSLADQIGRAAESIALNVSEGRLRCDGDQRRHWQMAAGSASEVTTALRIAVLRRYITRDDFAAVDADLDRVRAMLFRLTRR